MWEMRIKQYFQVQDYALLEVIENGNSWVSIPQTTQENGTSVTKMSVPVTAEEKTNKKNDVKARSLLLMDLPNEHQLTFSQYNDAKTMFAAIETRFGVITQKDLNLKFLRSLPLEWNTHVVVSMNKAEIETMSIDDLYNNFKIVEQNVKKSVGANTGAQNLAFITASSTSSTNDINTAKPTHEVSTISSNVNTASSHVSTANISDNVVYAFMVENPNGSNVPHQDIEQIHEDDLEAIDLKWQLSLLSIRAKRYYQRTGKKNSLMLMILLAPRNKEGQFRNQDNTRKQGNNEDTSSKTMLAIDGVGFDWSDMAEEQVQTNMALMAFLDYEVTNDKSCSKTYLKNYETLKKQCDDLIVKLNQTEFTAATYKRVLKREVACKDYEIGVLKSEFEKVKQEKKGIEFKIEKFDNASKCLDQLLGSQITDKSKKGLGYSDVSPPHPLIYNRPTKLDLSYSSLDEFKEPEFTSYGPKDNKIESNIVYDKKSYENSNDSLVEFVKPKKNEKLVKKSVRYTEMYRSPSPRGNQRNWNGQKSNQLGSDFVMYNKAYFICGSFDHVQINYPHHQRKRMMTRNNYNRVDYDYYAKTSHPSTHRNMTPRAVLWKSGLTPLSTARHVNTVRPKVVNTARPYTTPVNTIMANGVNAVKTSACWVWRPTRPNGASLGKPQMNDLAFVDSGCSRYMTGNIAYLSEFKEFDRGYVTFGGGAYGGRITGKGTLKTDNFDFEDVYFVNELKFNLFSVSQMCDKKNYVLFTDTECLVLSPNFNLPDESQILLKIPRKDNMYSFDMKNIVPKESLTCLVTKATLDESVLWHRRHGHINFKNINKLVKENLVRDLFGLTFMSSLMHKKYCLVVTDDYSRFTWVFFLATKDETSEILKNFIKEIENLVDKKVKIIRCDNGTEFKNKVMDDFCREKGIRREYSVARTPQQNRVAERRNRTLIEAARTMLADSKLPTTFWAEAVANACYVQNRVLIVKPHNKTPYELFRGFKPVLSFMRPFGCHVTILNTLDSLGKFDGKSDEGFFVGYYLSSKAFRVYNTRTRRVEENLHIGFLENKPMIEGNGIISNESTAIQGELNAGSSTQKEEISQDCIVMPIWKDASYFDSPSKNVGNDEPKSAADDQEHVEDGPHNESNEKDKPEDDSSHKEVNAAGQHVNTASPKVNTGRSKLYTVDPSVNTASTYDQDSPKDMFKLGASHTLKATHVDFFSDEDEPEVELGNILTSYTVPTTPNIRIHKDYPIKNVIEEPKRISKALSDSAWVEAMQEELLQFKHQMVWILMDLPKVKRAIGTKWIFRNKKDERGIVIRNKARLVAQGYTQEEVIDCDEVFSPVARIIAIRLFLAYASFMGFMVYQIDVKSAFLYGQIEEEVYVCQPLGFEDPDYPDKAYKVVKELYGLHQAPRAWTNEILKKFNYFDVKSASTLVDLEKHLVKDGDANDVDEHLYRSMTGSLMYLTTSRPDIIYSKGKPTLGLWYSRNSPFELVAYTDSDYAGATQDRKSTTRGCQLLGNRLISWQCKKQIMVATSTTEAECMAAAS
ncbi:ribonuclease H-like domain-containing protein [Tanacetum coccineum]